MSESPLLESINLRHLPNLKDSTLELIKEHPNRDKIKMILADNRREDKSSNFLSHKSGILADNNPLPLLNYEYFFYKNRDMIDNAVIIDIGKLSDNFKSNL